MWTRAIIATSLLLTLATATAADAHARRRVVHIYTDTVVVHPRAVVLPRRGIVIHGAVVPGGFARPRRAYPDTRPTRAALIACQMGPNFVGAAYRGKRYRPYTRTGRPRICVTG